MSKVFLIGQITGLPLVDIMNNFDAAKEFLTYRGFEVVNPIEIHHPVSADDVICTYLRTDVKLMMECYTVAYMPDWQDCHAAKFLVELSKHLTFNQIELSTNIWEYRKS